MEEANCFPSGTVVSHLKKRDKFKAIHELIAKAPVFDEVRDKKDFETAVVKREKALSTGLGHGIALAHGKSRAAGRLFIAMGRSRKGIDYGSYDREPVRLLFIIGNPPDTDDEYLRVVGALSRILRVPSFREKLISLKRGCEVESVLREKFESELKRDSGCFRCL